MSRDLGCVGDLADFGPGLVVLDYQFVESLTDTFAGIRPADAPGFILAQLVALTLVLPLLRRQASGN